MTKKKIELVEEEGLAVEEETSEEVTEVIEEVPIEEEIEEPKQQPNGVFSKASYYQEQIRIKSGGK